MIKATKDLKEVDYINNNKIKFNKKLTNLTELISDEED